MNISVIGTGYVGLVTGVCLAERGHQVTCVDVDQAKLRRIDAADPPIHEEGLASLLATHAGKSLTTTTDLADAVRRTGLTMICVGTPSSQGRIDLAQVQSCARQIGAALATKTGYHVVVVKSTVVPGTTDGVVTPALEAASKKRAGVDFGVGMNPEFLTEGQAVADFMHPDRIVLGGNEPRTLNRLAEVYASFTTVPTVRVNNRTAEMIKYASNAMLATQISFANEIANLCEMLGGIDVAEVQRGVHLSHYLQPFLDDDRGTRVRAPIASFLEAGCGFGGSCLPKDVTALVAHGRQAGAPMRVLEAVLETNASQPSRMIHLLETQIATLKDARVTVLGLAFKADTDDVRESPAIPIIRQLIAAGARVRAYDPVATENARAVLGELPVEYAATLEDAVTGADAVMLVTKWKEFQRLPDIVRQRDPQPVVIDGRRVLDPASVSRYAGIGLRQDANGSAAPSAGAKISR